MFPCYLISNLSKLSEICSYTGRMSLIGRGRECLLGFFWLFCLLTSNLLRCRSEQSGIVIVLVAALEVLESYGSTNPSLLQAEKT